MRKSAAGPKNISFLTFCLSEMLEAFQVPSQVPNCGRAVCEDRHRTHEAGFTCGFDKDTLVSLGKVEFIKAGSDTFFPHEFLFSSKPHFLCPLAQKLLKNVKLCDSASHSGRWQGLRRNQLSSFLSGCARLYPHTVLGLQSPRQRVISLSCGDLQDVRPPPGLP